MNNRKILFASLFGITALAVGIGTQAYQGNPWIENPDCSNTERHASVTQMFENGDYESFKTLYADKGIAKRITSEDQFLKFVELHEARLAGDTDKVNTLKAELGLGQRNQDGNGMRKGDRDGKGQGRGRMNK